MKNLQSFLVISSLLIFATPMAHAAEDNSPDAVAESKCAYLTSNREKVRCIYNNRQMRRNDVRLRIRKNHEDIVTKNRERLQNQMDQYMKSRKVLLEDCKSNASLSAATSKRALQRCIENRKGKMEKNIENTTDIQRGIRRGEINKAKDHGTARRTFQWNALQRQAERRKAIQKRGMIQYNPSLYRPDLGVVDNEDGDVENEQDEDGDDNDESEGGE